MFKNTVVLGGAVFLLLHLTTACGYVAPQSRNDLPNSIRRSIANELVAASTPYWSNTKKPVHIQVVPDQHWLLAELHDVFTANEYQLVNEPVTNRSLVAVATEFGGNGLQVSITIDKEHTVERLFRFEHVDQREASNAFVESDHSRLEAMHVPIERKVWVESGPGSPPEKHSQASSLNVETPHTFNATTQNDASVSAACLETVLQKGSLKQNLIQILQACGWRLVEWPMDPDKPEHELDWLVPITQTLTFESLNELTHALRIAFDLEVELDGSTKSVRIQSRE